MRPYGTTIARSWRALVLGLLGVGAAAVILLVAAVDYQSPPVVVLLIPVMVMALVSTPIVTSVIASAAILVGWWAYSHSPVNAADEPVRFGSMFVLAGLAVALSVVLRRREDRIRRQEAELAAVRHHESAERLLVPLLERLPEMSGARDIPDVALRACHIAREVFGAETASYWQIEGEQCVLLVREPPGDPSPPLVQIPRRFMTGDSQFEGRSRTTWVDVEALDADDPRREFMRRTGVRVGASTPIRVDFATVGYLAMSWTQPQPAPEPAWMETLDRLGDQMALAKTVVRRQMAQRETRALTDRLQASFQPAHVADVPHALVRILYRPGTRQLLLGGDFLDVAETASEGTAFLIGDVSGHGPEQAALAATLRAAWRGAVSVRGSSLEERVAAMDIVVQGRRTSPGLFVTVVTGEIDSCMSSMEYVCAGHPPPLLLPGGAQTSLGGPPLGIVPGINRERDVHKVDLQDHDGVLLVTDGLFEGYEAPGAADRLGFDAFASLVGERNDWTSTRFLDALADDLETRNGGPMPDDAAALLLIRRPSSG